MVDFRYHLVSIIAVFLALAVGIVVGTAALNGPIQDKLNDNISRLTSDKRALEADLRGLQGELTAADAFATAFGPQLVDGALEDQRVLFVTTPQTPTDLAERLRPLLSDAGATVTGSVEVRPTLADPQQRRLLEDLVAQVLPAGVELPDGDPVERAAAELAAALTHGRQDPVDRGEAQAVVSAFQEAGLIGFSADPDTKDTIASATVVVLLASPGLGREPGTAEQQQLEALLTVAAAFDTRSRGAVLAGPAQSAVDGGLIRALRTSSTLARGVSSVDNADRGPGRIAVVLAVAEQVEKGVGQYGAGPGASAPLPAAATS
ncbi:MAG: copper transporter [Mycobacteriales bacterium]